MKKRPARVPNHPKPSTTPNKRKRAGRVSNNKRNRASDGIPNRVRGTKVNRKPRAGQPRLASRAGRGSASSLGPAWLRPNIMRWKDFVPLRKKFKPGSKAWKRKRVKAYAVIAVFREASSNKPARLEIDFVRLGNTKTAAAIDKLSFKELTRISEEQAYTIPLKVISVVAARDLKEIRRSDKTRKIKFKKNAKKFGKLSGYFPIHAKRDSQKRLVWGGKNGTERAARVALKRLLSSREGAASVAHRKNPRR